MRGLGSVRSLLWILFLQLGSCNYAEILWGQCYAFCLTRQESRQKKENSNGQIILSEKAITACLKHRECKWCLFACERPREEYDDYKDCQTDCKQAIPHQDSRGRYPDSALQACSDSCEYISKSTQTKHGTCPAPSAMQGLDTACVFECARDVDCDGVKKCCDNSCGKVCHRAMKSTEIPKMQCSLNFKERNNGGMIVEWESHTHNNSLPVVYVFRWWCPYVHGVRFSVTTTARVKLKGYPSGVPPAAKCHFMVAAINVHGSEGFCPEQVYTKKFLNPSPPVNLETTKFKLHDGKVDVTVRWQPPLYTDGLKVTRYLVFWSGNLPKASPSYMRLYMKKKALSGERTSYTIPGLEPSSNYFVQVRAEVKWKEKTIRGRPVSTYIETHSVEQPGGPDSDIISSDGHEGKSPISNVTIHEPMFINSHLRANVTWSLELGYHVEKYILYWNVDVCDKEANHRKTRDRLKQEATTHKREFQLYGLQFGCVYELRIHTVRLGIMGEGIREFFRTHPCWETPGQGLEAVCPPKVSPPVTPSDLTVHYKSTRGCMCQAVIRWQRLSQPIKVNQYLLLWGQSRPPQGGELSSAIVYYAEPYEIQVSGTENQACMTYLESDKHYTAQIIALASKMKSQPAVHHFTTPASMSPCYGSGIKTADDLSSGYLGSVQKDLEDRSTTTAHVESGSLPQTVSIFLAIVCCIFHVTCK